MKQTLVNLLSELYGASLARADSEYLRLQSSPAAIARHVEAFLGYRPHLPETGAILDWGCRHAPDACLIRRVLDDAVELFGCDFGTEASWRPFHEYASMQYAHLADLVRLPYDDGRFRAVIGSGVLEHAAMDLESLKELHRVLEPGGVLVLTFLPNRWSYTEWACRRLGLAHHRRVYSRRGVRELLLHFGFEPVCVRYHQFLPARRLQGLLGPLGGLNAVLERAWPTRVVCANLMVVARRCTVI